MDDKGNPRGAVLTEEQRRLVRENIGLVAVHLRRFVPNLAMPRRDREWDDLFQEGCIGLIRAAAMYRPESGIAFAAYALPRIHSAVSRALRRRFSTVYVPDKRAACTKPEGDAEAGDGPKHPKTYSASPHLENCLVDRRHATRRADLRSEESMSGETVGQRLRDKYERAVRRAGKVIATRTSIRGDREELIRVLTEERLLVPHTESRRALRQIARDTRSSYARVAQCEKSLADAVRRTLEADPEFARLETYIRNDSTVSNIPIDAALEEELAAVCAREFIRRYRKADGDLRAAMLARLLEVSPGDVEGLLSGRVFLLTPPMRERLLA